MENEIDYLSDPDSLAGALKYKLGDNRDVHVIDFLSWVEVEDPTANYKPKDIVNFLSSKLGISAETSNVEILKDALYQTHLNRKIKG